MVFNDWTNSENKLKNNRKNLGKTQNFVCFFFLEIENLRNNIYLIPMPNCFVLDIVFFKQNQKNSKLI